MLEAVAKTVEGRRLAQSGSPDSAWRRWGPYLASRQWGTVREDYSHDGAAWADFPFDQAHTRAFRWGEDGLGGVCDRYGFLNLAVALWNGRDDRLKERLFGLTGPEGNHGEDVKEYYWALDATPTHSWAQWLYRYPQAAFPYQQLRDANRERGYEQDEYELADTGVLEQNRFFDVTVTHAKVDSGDLCVVYEATNHGPDPAPLHLVPQLWFRNTWAWGRDRRRASMQQRLVRDDAGHVRVTAEHAWLNRCTLAAEGAPRVLWCDNETDEVAAFGAEENRCPHPKSAVDRAIVHGDESLLSPDPNGTKVAFDYHFEQVQPGQTVRVRLRLCSGEGPEQPFDESFQRALEERRAEADEFYAAVIPPETSEVDRLVARRAFAGLNWAKQLYRYSVREWLEGDPAGPQPPTERRAPEPQGRNTSWTHLDLADVISMPDDWEYPWFASWDLAFHAVALAHIDPAFAKQQLLLICREWSQHPDGQLPAYEWSFSDVNPPVHAWAAWLVYQADGANDVDFLTRIMTKLLLNFGWWVNRKDEAGNDLFEGGFLGMDNISVFDRSSEVPDGWRLEQSDATSWIAFFCLRMLRIAEELALTSPAWGDVATTFLERFLSISQAVENFGGEGQSLWDEEDGFFYDILVGEDGSVDPVRVRSLVGLVPLLAVSNTPRGLEGKVPDLEDRRAWLVRNRPDLSRYLLTEAGEEGREGRGSLSLVDLDRYPRILQRLFDPEEFLSDYGIRSLSAAYRGGRQLDLIGRQMHMQYVSGYSADGMFGGNSNWRGPIWFPLNVLLVDALRTRAEGVGGQQQVEFPTGSGHQTGLAEAADAIEQRLLDLFRPGVDGRRPGAQRDQPTGELWDCHPVFSEFFDGDDGTGLGASHQTGWTAMAAHMICRRPEGRQPAAEQTPAESPQPEQTH
ncbi:MULTISPECIES: MGH1-like glycoside hydrolase domain-containing protein [unclassified Luteococcus]|uniref:MGH1-like glycoside hydrolase domain-containing protein n=1 Tax=unclassified Luteococcus TaxID=2639923 RepID=UPI00313CCD03